MQPKQEKSSIPVVLPGQLNMFAELDAALEARLASEQRRQPVIWRPENQLTLKLDS